MPQGAGTSVEGWQKVVSETNTEQDIFYLSIDGDSGNVPYDVGYFYICCFSGDGDPQAVFDTGIVYRQGITRMLPPGFKQG